MKGWICAVGLVVIMFWNVENFFDPFDDPLKNDDEFTASGLRHWSWSRFVRKRDAIAKTVLSVKDAYGSLPDLVGMAEVENRMVLRQLVEKSPLGELDYGFVHRESPDSRGIDVALLYRRSRFRPLHVDSIRLEGLKTRDILLVELQTEQGDTLNVIVLHFPSKRGGARSSDSRRQYAELILRRCTDSLLARRPDARIVVMGDFNDGPSSPSSGTIKFQGNWETIDRFMWWNLEAENFIYSPSFLLEEDKTYLGVKPRRTYIGPRYNGGVSDHLPVILIAR